MSRFASAPWPLRAAGIVLASACGLAVLTGLTLTVALSGLHRLTPDLDPWAAPAWFWYFRGDPQVQRWLKIGAICAAGAALAAAAGVARRLQPPLFGTTRWAREPDLRRAGLRAPTGLLLGRAHGRPLVFGGAEHALLYAPTRSGKGVGVVIPNLLTWPDSAVILDVKRENWEATAGFRAAHGQTVLLFDPFDSEGRTARFNPLGHIDRNAPDVVLDELQRLAVMLFPAPLNADPFWAEAARTGFIGVGAYVAETPDLPFSLGAIYAELTHGDPKVRLPALAAARDAAGAPLPDGCSAALRDFCAASDNTFASVKQTLTARLNLWLNPRVRATTDASDFDLRDLRERRISLYLAVSPDNLTRVAPLYNLFLQQLVDLNTRERPTGARHAVPVLVLLDEFARLGHAGALAHGFAYVAGYGLRLLPVLQSPAQLRAEYGPDLTEEIIANCAVEVVFAPKALGVARDLSERLGYATVPGFTRSRPVGLSSGRRALSESDHRRALMLPQELLRMPADQLIVLKAGSPPVRGRKIVYWRERAFTRRVVPPPVVPPRLLLPSPPPSAPPPAPPSAPGPCLDLQDLVPVLADAGFEPVPPKGAPVDAVAAWVERFIDASALTPEPAYGRPA